MIKNSGLKGLLLFSLLLLMIQNSPLELVYAQTQLTQIDSQQKEAMTTGTSETLLLKQLKSFPMLVLKEPVIRSDYPLYLLVQWGDLRVSESHKWNGSIAIDQGKIMILKQVGLEPEDLISADSKDLLAPTRNIKIDSKTGPGRDGLLLKIISNDAAQIGDSEVTFQFNERTMKFPLKKLFESNGPISDGTSAPDDFEMIRLTSVHRLGNVAVPVRDRYFSLKLKALGRFFAVENYLKKMADEGKFPTSAQSPQEQFASFETVLDNAYRLEYTENMVLEINKAFDLWEVEWKKDQLPPEKLLMHLEGLMEKISLLSLKEKYRDGVTPFCDIDETAWFSDYVEFLKTKKIVSGDANGCTFRPEVSVSRAEFLKMVLEATGNTAAKVDAEIASTLAPDSNSFEDARTHWARNYIIFAKIHGFLDNTSPSFYPDRAITRLEALIMFQKPLELAVKGGDGGQLNVAGETQDKLKAWRENYLAKAQELGIIDPAQEYFRPSDPLNRAEAAKIIALVTKITDEQGKMNH